MLSARGEDELLRELDAHDALVVRCARGELTWDEFERAYNTFYLRYPLDGHESNPAELALFEKYAHRIAIHREIWEQIETKVTATAHAGFIAPEEAVRRLQALAEQYLKR